MKIVYSFVVRTSVIYIRCVRPVPLRSFPTKLQHNQQIFRSQASILLCYYVNIERKLLIKQVTTNY